MKKRKTIIRISYMKNKGDKLQVQKFGRMEKARSFMKTCYAANLLRLVENDSKVSGTSRIAQRNGKTINCGWRQDKKAVWNNIHDEVISWTSTRKET